MFASLLCAVLISSSQGLNVKRVVNEKSAAERAQEAQCEGVEPKALCLTKMYTWGLVWLHGLGNGPTSQMYEKMLIPTVMSMTGMPAGSGLMVFPKAPHAFVISDNITEPSWHQQEKVKCDTKYKPPHHGYSLEDGLKNVHIVHEKINQLRELGIPANKIIVAGHSQGGSMVYLSSMMFPERLLGAINLSGGLLGWYNIPQHMHKSNKGLPMFWIKGNKDEIVPQAHQDEIMPKLKEAGFPVETAYFNGGHDLTDPIVPALLSGWINNKLWESSIRKHGPEETTECPCSGVMPCYHHGTCEKRVAIGTQGGIMGQEIWVDEGGICEPDAPDCEAETGVTG